MRITCPGSFDEFRLTHAFRTGMRADVIEVILAIEIFDLGVVGGDGVPVVTTPAFQHSLLVFPRSPGMLRYSMGDLRMGQPASKSEVAPPARIEEVIQTLLIPDDGGSPVVIIRVGKDVVGGEGLEVVADEEFVTVL